MTFRTCSSNGTPSSVGALLELVARHLPGEALVLHLLGDGPDVDLVEAAVRADVA